LSLTLLTSDKNNDIEEVEAELRRKAGKGKVSETELNKRLGVND